MGCHAQVVQFPSNALLLELGQASLAIALAGSLMADRVASQAPNGVLDYYLTINTGQLAFSIKEWLTLPMMALRSGLSIF